jgi:hypothetical protein
MNGGLIGKYLVDKRNKTSGDVAQIIDIKHNIYYLVKWIRVEKEDKRPYHGHKVDSYAMYTQDRVNEEFELVDKLSEVMAVII